MRAMIFVAFAGVARVTLAQPAPPTPAAPATPAQPMPAPAAPPVAQPATPPPAPGLGDRAEAAALYDAATTAMNERRYADAVRDFTAAFDLTRDPVLLFKIAAAHDQAGACDLAVPFYQRYLDEGKPAPEHAELTNDRLAKCAPQLATAPGGSPAPGSPPAPRVTSEPGATSTPGAAPAPGTIAPDPRKNAAWLLVGGALAFVTTGAVLAYSAESSEQDIRDLYVGFAGSPPTFDLNTRTRYDELIAEGRRYERLSWASFGLATGCAIGAAVLFVRSSRETVTVTPVVSPKQTGLAAMIRF